MTDRRLSPLPWAPKRVARSWLSHRAMWVAATSFWLFVAVMSAAQILWASQNPGQGMNVRGAIIWQTVYFVVWIPFTIGVWQLTRHWLPERLGGWVWMVAAHLPVFATVTIVQTFVMVLLSAALAEQQTGTWGSFVIQLRGRLSAQLLIYTAIAGTGAAITLYERYQERQLAASRLEAELAAARLQALRGHLQPHFLFNSLHSIAALARTGDTAGVVRLTAGLSDLLRYVLDAGGRHSAPLHEELQIVERYLEIQRARFPDRLAVTVDLAPDVADARVPLLLVQLLVENAVRHGLAPRVREGSLFVRAVRDNGCTRIDVEDTGVGLPPGWTLHDSTGTGLRNLASRLSAEFGDAAALAVGPREGGGVRATVTLPYTPS
jgi:two-component system LytT family sensor kinase